MKIYATDNYFIVEYPNGSISQGLAKNVFVKQDNINSTIFYIFGVAGGFSLEIKGVAIGDIQDQAGTDYTLNTWTTFYRTSTGN